MVSQRFDEFWRSYPRKFGKDSACHDWISVVNSENEEAFFLCLARYLQSAEVARGAVMSAGSTIRDTGWIIKCFRDDFECDWPQAKTAVIRLTPTQIALNRALEAENVESRQIH